MKIIEMVALALGALVLGAWALSNLVLYAGILISLVKNFIEEHETGKDS